MNVCTSFRLIQEIISWELERGGFFKHTHLVVQVSSQKSYCGIEKFSLSFTCVYNF